MVFLTWIPFMTIGFAYHNFEEIESVENTFLKIFRLFYDSSSCEKFRLVWIDVYGSITLHIVNFFLIIGFVPTF